MQKEKWVTHLLLKPLLKTSLRYMYAGMKHLEGYHAKPRFHHELPRRLYAALMAWREREPAHLKSPEVAETAELAAYVVCKIMDVEQGWYRVWWVTLLKCLDEEGLLSLEKVKNMKEKVW